MKSRRPRVDYHNTDEGPAIARVELYEHLEAGESAKAKIVFLEGDEYTASNAEITVYDALGMTSGRSGDRLWAIYRRDSERWEALSVKAKQIWGALNEALPAGGSAMMSVLAIDTAGHYDTGRDVRVWDQLANADGDPYPKYSRVTAAWSYESNRYVITNVNCVPEFADALPPVRSQGEE